MRFITIKTAQYASQLVVIMGRLQSEGINCQLKNELTSQVLNYISGNFVELQVEENDLDKAMEIISNLDNEKY